MTPTFPIPVEVKQYVALLNQSGTAAPVATVLKNTLSGNIVWTRADVGQYLGTLTGEFTTSKVVLGLNNNTSNEAILMAKRFDGNSVLLETAGGGGNEDDLLIDTPITINIYQ